MSEIAAVHCEREHAYTYAAQSVARLCEPGVGRPGRRNAHLCTRRGAGIGASIQRYSSDSSAACDFLTRLPVRSVWVACGVGLLSRRTARTAALTLGSMLLVCALVLDVPKNAANIGSIMFAIWVVTLRGGLSKRRQRSCWWNFQTYAGRNGTYATCRSSLHPDIRFELSCCSIR